MTVNVLTPIPLPSKIARSLNQSGLRMTINQGKDPVRAYKQRRRFGKGALSGLFDELPNAEKSSTSASAVVRCSSGVPFGARCSC